MTAPPEHDRLDRRRQAIIDTARALFIEQGYAGTTLLDIVDRSGGSLATIYKLFGNKEGLLDEVVFEKAVSGQRLVQRAASDGGSPADILRRIAADLHAHFLKPGNVALVRIMIAHSIENTEFARRYFETTASRTRKALERLFADWQDAGMKMNGSPMLLAEVFLGLNVSDLQNEAVSHGIIERPSIDRLTARTDFFLKGAGLFD